MTFPRVLLLLLAVALSTFAAALPAQAPQPVAPNPSAPAAALPPAQPTTVPQETPAEHPAALRIDGAEKLLRQRKRESAIKVLTGVLSDLEGELDGGDSRVVALACRAYGLRALAQAAAGRGSAAEADFKRLVPLCPAWLPDELAFPAQTLQRFRKVREGLVGFVTVSCEPAGIPLTLDGRPAGECPAANLPLLAGEHRFTAAKAGFDEAESSVVVAAGARQEVRLALVPNARTVLVSTIPAGVEVFLDGTRVGVTQPAIVSGSDADSGAEAPRQPVNAERDPPGEPTASPQPAAPPLAAPAAGTEGPSAPLALALVPPGEHELVFRKDCHAEQRRSLSVVVDLLDSVPVVVPPVAVPRAEGRLSIVSEPPGGIIALDDRMLGPAPWGAPVCAGTHDVEVRFGESARWHAPIEILAGRPVEFTARPRPDLIVFLGRDGPAEESEEPDPRADVMVRLRDAVRTLANWNLGSVPEGAPAGEGLRLTGHVEPGERLRLHFELTSSVLPVSERREFDAEPQELWSGWIAQLDDPLSTSAPAVGAILLDTRLTDGPVVLSVRSGSPAEAAGMKAGDTIVSVAGQKAAGAAEARRLWSRAGAGSTSVEIQRAGIRLTLPLTLSPSPALVAYQGGRGEGAGQPPVSPGERVPFSWNKLAVQATLAGAIAPEPQRSLARLDLASMLLRFGEPEAAMNQIRRGTALVAGAGVSAGSGRYLLGIALERAGRAAEAAAAFREAAGHPEATVDNLDGIAIAALAAARAEALSAHPASRSPSGAPPAPPVVPPGAPRPSPPPAPEKDPTPPR